MFFVYNACSHAHQNFFSLHCRFHIVFNSLYAINLSDKFAIAHLRLAQFRKLLHIANFCSLFSFFLSFSLFFYFRYHISIKDICETTHFANVESQALFSSAMHYAQSHVLSVRKRINCCKSFGVISFWFWL